MSVSRETKKFINVIYLLCAQTFSDMHVCTGNYGPDFGHRAEKKGTFSSKFNSGSKADRCWRGAETSLIHEGREKKFILTLPQRNRNSKVDFRGKKSKVFTVKTRTEKLSTNITWDPNKLV